MNKKTVFAYIVLIGCIALLIGSYMQWKEKTSSFQGGASEQITTETAPTDKIEQPLKPELEVERLLTLTNHVDESVQDVFIKRLEANEKVNFLIAGSTSMEDGAPGYAEQLSSALEEAYGDFIEVTIEAFDKTSDLFIQNLSTEIDFDKGFDVVLFEPFTLNNNGEVSIDDEHQHIKIFQERLKEETEDAVVVLHPPNPIHAASYYPTQVSALNSFAESAGIPYIDHWKQWPDPDTDEINDYLDDNGSPNKEGAEVWANVLIEYFVGK
ncbi:SGNH/GDSL hydrolase family protein [Sporosarcina sp. G11-34]|uniref:SGNH/GDSL hydrolase family protein n=1 Tax=Sporosarcina sp. G11-34 TaxID=2849605 RepID=UPI0022A9D188|nr:SGNH/GDSL hydrolase family protein [Sporosarcina sp. G11-34]MCZ2258643.1 SGNH/GDSL hydrolase family protein [Sporosarcina sp. G11-34]